MFVWSTICGQLKLLQFLNGYLWLLTLSSTEMFKIKKWDWKEPCGKGRKKWVKLSALKSERKYSGIVIRRSIWRERRESWRKGGSRQKEKGNGISAEKKKQSLDNQRKQWISKRKKVNTIKRKIEHDRTKQAAQGLEVELKVSKKERYYSTGKRDKEVEMKRGGQKRKRRWKKNAREKNKATNFWLVDIFICSLATRNYESENQEAIVLHMLL